MNLDLGIHKREYVENERFNIKGSHSTNIKRILNGFVDYKEDILNEFGLDNNLNGQDRFSFALAANMYNYIEKLTKRDISNLAEINGYINGVAFGQLETVKTIQEELYSTDDQIHAISSFLTNAVQDNFTYSFRKILKQKTYEVTIKTKEILQDDLKMNHLYEKNSTYHMAGTLKHIMELAGCKIIGNTEIWKNPMNGKHNLTTLRLHYH